MNTELSPRLIVAAIVVILGLIVGAGSFLLFGGAGAPADEAATNADASFDVGEPADDTRDEPAQVDDRAADGAAVAPESDGAETSSDDEAGSEETDGRPEVPTVVIGQDEDGNEILMEIEVTGGCAQTFHEPLDENSFSFIRWAYEAPGIEPGTPVLVSTAGFEHFTVVTPDYRVVVEQGITSYGDYPFPSLEWNTGDGSTSSIDVFENHTVDDREGEASETCLEEDF